MSRLAQPAIIFNQPALLQVALVQACGHWIARYRRLLRVERGVPQDSQIESCVNFDCHVLAPSGQDPGYSRPLSGRLLDALLRFLLAG